MRALISFLFLTVSCGGDFCEEPDFEVAGLKICTDSPVDPEEVEIVVEIVERRVREVYPQVPTNTAEGYKRNDIRVQFIDSDLSTECEELSGGIYQCKHHP